MIRHFLSDILEQSLHELNRKNIILRVPISPNKFDNLIKSNFGNDTYTVDMSSNIPLSDFCVNLTKLNTESVLIIENINCANREFIEILTFVLERRQLCLHLEDNDLKKQVIIDLADCSIIAPMRDGETLNYPLTQYFNIQLNLSSSIPSAPLQYSDIDVLTSVEHSYENKNKHYFAEENQIRIGLKFQINRGIIDKSSIYEEEEIEIINNLINFCIKNKNSEAVNFLIPKMNFEWNWSNCDGDPDEFFLETDDIFFSCNEENCKLKIDIYEDSVAITASVEFFLNVKQGVDLSVLQEWINENSLYACGYVGIGSWTYAQSDGENVLLTSINGKNIDTL